MRHAVRTVDMPIRVTAPGEIRMWCRDLVSCLQATMATVLIHAGHEPLHALGLHFEFRHLPGDVRSEEFYFPCATPGDLAGSLMPHHPVASTWHRAPAGPAGAGAAEAARADAAGADAHGAGTAGRSGLEALAAELAQGRLVIAAVDNFHLPFRPAFGDVHAAHLLVVYGIDEEEGTVHVCDAMPPAFSGPIPIDAFLRSWSSPNPSDVQDAFFSDSRIDRRYLTVAAGRPFPALDLGRLHAALDHSLELFHRPPLPGDTGQVGLAGLDRYLETLVSRAEAGDEDALREAYPFGWGMQAQAALHGELLRTWGAREDLPELREAGRLVETVAHAWTGLRVCAAHGRHDPVHAVPELARHARNLRRAYGSAVEGLAEAGNGGSR